MHSLAARQARPYPLHHQQRRVSFARLQTRACRSAIAGSRRSLRVQAIGFSFDDEPTDSDASSGEMVQIVNVRLLLSTLTWGRDSMLAWHARTMLPHRTVLCLLPRPGPAPAPVPKMSTLTTLAASLLIFGPVLKGAVGEAFLAAMTLTGKFQASNKDILAAYGKLYNLIMQAGYSSWQEYLIDQVRGNAAVSPITHTHTHTHARISFIPLHLAFALPQILLGRDNAFARSAAQGSIEDGAPVLKAVAYDLDVLQQLHLSMARLASYFGDAAPVLGPTWEAAGETSCGPF
jgi:hypothetical protein